MNGMLRRWVLAIAVAAALLAVACRAAPGRAEEWEGLDDKLGRAAEKAGHPPAKPLWKIEGDVELFMFLAAGAGGGFIAGYAFRSLFPPKRAQGDTPATQDNGEQMSHAKAQRREGAREDS